MIFGLVFEGWIVIYELLVNVYFKILFGGVVKLDIILLFLVVVCFWKFFNNIILVLLNCFGLFLWNLFIIFLILVVLFIFESVIEIVFLVK